MITCVRQAGNQRVKSRPKRNVEREKNMTVCIAAVYKTQFPHVEGIAFVTDWQETDSNTEMKSQGAWKIQFIAKNIVVLGADDMVLFHDLVWRVLDKIEARNLKGTLTVRQAAELYVEAESDYKREYLDRHVLGNLGTSWNKFEAQLANDELPQSYVDNIHKALSSVQVPYATETIFAGLESPYTSILAQGRIFKIRPDTPIEDHTPNGYAIIGSGDLIADAEFKQGFYDRFLPKHVVLSYCLIVKKRCEVIASVGDETGLWVLEHGQHYNSVPYKIRARLERDYETLKRQREENDYKTCNRSEKYFEEYEKHIKELNESAGKDKGQNERKSAGSDK